MEVLKKAARVSQVIMGLVLLVSGLVKVWEPVLFFWEVVPYTQLLGVQSLWQVLVGAGMAVTPSDWGMFSSLQSLAKFQVWPVVSQAILFLAPFEVGLGLALLANWRPRLVFPVSVVLMVFFVGLMVAAWMVGATDDCGCFGSLVERGPGAAAVEDTVMLALLLFGWWGTRGRGGWRWGNWLVGGGTVLALVVGLVQFVPEMERLEGSDLLPGVRLTGLNPKGLEVDIRRGEYLLELMSPRCGHCMSAVPKLNQLMEEPDLPKVIALTSFPQGSEPLQEFIARLQPRFPIGTITRTDFFRLTVKHTYPRLAYVRDGVVRRVWEYDGFPTVEQVRAAVAEDR